MNVLVVVAHPDPASFNHALAGAAVEAARSRGHAVVLHDLHGEGFDPIVSRAEIPKDADLPPWLRRHCDELAAADGIVVVHPNWWGQPPAILKGWIDRVIRPGVAYAFREGDGGEGVPVGLLRARTAIVLNTANTPPEREREVFGDPLEALAPLHLRPVRGPRRPAQDVRSGRDEHPRAARRVARRRGRARGGGLPGGLTGRRRPTSRRRSARRRPDRRSSRRAPACSPRRSRGHGATR